jgi:hypothetical protein
MDGMRASSSVKLARTPRRPRDELRLIIEVRLEDNQGVLFAPVELIREHHHQVIAWDVHLHRGRG